MGKKNKKQKKKPRTYSIEASFKANSENITFSLVDGKLIAYGENGEVELLNCLQTTSYARDNPLKPQKVINTSPSHQNSLYPNTTLKDIDCIYAVDTNTKEVGNGFFSVGVLVEGKFTEKTSLGCSGNYTAIKVIHSFNEYKHPVIEQYCYMESIKYIQTLVSDDKRVALVIDSDLARITDINKHSQPLIEDFYLPANFVLIYASSDVGKEFLPNKMISLSDTMANQIFEIIYREYKKSN